MRRNDFDRRSTEVGKGIRSVQSSAGPFAINGGITVFVIMPGTRPAILFETRGGNTVTKEFMKSKLQDTLLTNYILKSSVDLVELGDEML